MIVLEELGMGYWVSRLLYLKSLIDFVYFWRSY
jgi:hypothetical protein